MALPLTLIIILGEIDLSVESMAGLASAALGFMWAANVPLGIAIPIVLVMGALGGLLNGTLVARGGLPSLVVTLGTLALFRGMALIILGPQGISNFPPEFTALGFGDVPGTVIPWPFVIFLGLALVLGIVLHRTWIGRQTYAIGRNAGTARYSGVRVARLRISLFVLSGTIAALAGVILTSRLSSARADAGAGMTITAVTVVLLGGANIFGGSGTIPGYGARRAHRGGDAERAPPGERVGRGSEHRPRVAPDPLRPHSNLRSPGQVGHRSHPWSAGTSRPIDRGRAGASHPGIEEERS